MHLASTQHLSVVVVLLVEQLCGLPKVAVQVTSVLVGRHCRIALWSRVAVELPVAEETVVTPEHQTVLTVYPHRLRRIPAKVVLVLLNLPVVRRVLGAPIAVTRVVVQAPLALVEAVDAPHGATVGMDLVAVVATTAVEAADQAAIAVPVAVARVG